MTPSGKSVEISAYPGNLHNDFDIQTNQSQPIQNISIKPEILDKNRQTVESQPMVNCDSCTFSTQDQQVLAIHKLGAHGQKSDKSMENDLMPRHGDKKPEKCCFCDNYFVTQQELKHHTETAHKFQCLDCKLGFQSMEILQKHNAAVHPKSKNFQDQINLVWTENAQNQNNSETSNKQVPSVQITTTHQSQALTLPNENNQGSTENPANSVSPNQLPSNDSTYDQKMQFLCNICNGGFNDEKSVLRHITSVHQERRKFKCTYCNLEFQTDKVLQKHQATVHSPLLAASGFKHCGQCNASFGTMELLDEHLKTVHGVQKQSIMREMIRYQSGKPAMCPICGVGFTGQLFSECHQFEQNNSNSNFDR